VQVAVDLPPTDYELMIRDLVTAATRRNGLDAAFRELGAILRDELLYSRAPSTNPRLPVIVAAMQELCAAFKNGGEL
jgi:hypothetical protein